VISSFLSGNSAADRYDATTEHPARPRPAGCDAESLGLAPSEPRRGPAGGLAPAACAQREGTISWRGSPEQWTCQSDRSTGAGGFRLADEWFGRGGRHLCSLPPTIGRQDLAMTRA